jgi:hypothetical protein
MSLDLTVIIAVGGFSIAVVNFLYSRFKTTADLDKRITVIEEKEKNTDFIDDILAIKDRLTKLESREDLTSKLNMICEDVRELKIKEGLVWGAVEKAMVDLLHHPNEVERDVLLEKLRDKTITLAEMEVLEELLQNAIIKKKGNPESIAATLLLAVVKQKIYENTSKIEVLKGCL